ncbi:unnamed protein product, partial [Cyprideis torosa]
ETEKAFPRMEKGTESILGALPFFHVFGLSVAMNFSIFMAWKNILIPKPEPEKLLQAIKKYKPTFGAMVPTMFIGVLGHQEIDKVDMSCFKGLFSGSAPLPLEVLQEFEKRTGAAIVEGFGLTETSPVTHINPFEGKRKPGSIGVPISDTLCKVVDILDSGKEMASGQAGELLVKGPQVMREYLHQKEETQNTFVDGWLKTGDIAKMDDDGYFFIIDRLKDMIISGGYNVFPREIDEVLFLHPKVKEASSVGVPHPTRGEQVKSFVVLHEEWAGTTEEEIMAFCEQNLAKYKLPTSIVFLEELPKTAVGKVARVTLKKKIPQSQEGLTAMLDRVSQENYAIAVDIGTTTVYGQLIDLNTGQILAQKGLFNKQISYGEDVISRIIVAEKEEGRKKMQEMVLMTINEILGTLFSQTGVAKDNVSTITMAGNTTMTQLLLAINPRYIRRAPYVPAATLYPPFPAASIGIELSETAVALLYPQISSYVGGDIVAGIMGAGLYRSEELTIYLDIGTNAEIVIGNKDWMACAACSAGPAFEGGGVEFGMRASQGAIEDFLINPETLEPMLLTIGDVRPKGICGSGLITMLAVMFEMGIIDHRGKFNRDRNTKRIRNRNDVWEYVVCWQEETQIDRDIILSEVDIDNLIRAKAAIYSGCMTLLDEVGLSMDMVEHITLAGGFGSYIDLEKAMVIGLLPEIAPEQVTYLGNGSLLGARMSALTNKIRHDVVDVTKKMTNFELSETPSYMDNYVAAMFIPHTDVNRFPKLKERMTRRTSLQNRVNEGKQINI